MKISRRWGIALVAAGVAAVVAYGDGPTSADDRSRVTTGTSGQRGPTGQIDEGVYVPYEKADHQDTFAIYGADTVAGPIQRLRENAANIAARDPECGNVVWSEFALNRSRPSRLVVYADCESGKRFYVDDRGEVETEKNAPLL